MDKNSKIFVAGHKGMVGSAILRHLQQAGYRNIIYRTSSELDLTRQAEVEGFFSTEKPEYVFLAAAKVGGIHANNTYPAEFIYKNLMIESNVIHSSYENNVTKLLFLGSSCIYPKMAGQPIKEEYLLSGYLEPTNEAYAIAKIAGLKLCEFYNQQYNTQFISAMPTNLYGPNDNYDLQSSHVFPALIKKIHEAKVLGSPEVVIWGSGNPRREFLHVDDLADASLFLMLNYNESSTINVGHGKDISILELAKLIGEIIGYEGKIVRDLSKPDGTPRKLLDTFKLSHLGWTPKIGLRQGISSTYEGVLKGGGFNTAQLQK